MRTVVVALCVLGIGCAAGAEMRPRGKRNSVKIEALEKRIATLEQQIATMSKEMHALFEANHPKPAPAP